MQSLYIKASTTIPARNELIFSYYLVPENPENRLVVTQIDEKYRKCLHLFRSLQISEVVFYVLKWWCRAYSIFVLVRFCHPRAFGRGSREDS